MTLDDALAVYLDYLRVERALSANSRAAYARDLTKLVDYLAAAGVDEPAAGGPVDRERLNAFLVHLQETGLSNRSVARHVSSVRGWFAFLLSDGHVDVDPAEILRAPSWGRPLPRTLTLDEVEAVLAAPDPDLPRGLRDRALLEVLYATGIRISELCGLRLDDLRDDGQLLLVRGKGGKQRLVPLGSRPSRPGAATGAGGARRGRARTDGPCSRAGARRPCAASRSGSASRSWRGSRGSRPPCPPTSCATRSRPTCWNGAPTCAPSRPCWATRTSRRPRSTLT